MDIRKVIKGEILEQREYYIEDRPCRIKLDANENPYTISPSLKGDLLEYLNTISLNRYPDPGSGKLRAKLAEYYGVDEAMLLVGNGSDELIQILLTAFNSSPSGGVLIPSPTFAMYRISAVNTGHRVIEIPLNNIFDLDIEPILDAMSRCSPHLIFLSYPNNPTGNLFDRTKIEKILAKAEGIVVVDEAYYNFAGKTFLPDLDKWGNLIILRTLSKIGFASIRLGVLIGQHSIVRELNKVRLPYNINAFSQAIAIFVIEHEKAFQNQIDQIIQNRDNLFNKLRNIEGIHPHPSSANFILFSCATDKNELYNTLFERGIVIKNFSSPHILKDCMRVTVGSEEENQEFIGALSAIIHR